jgi:hypothetical protein
MDQTTSVLSIIILRIAPYFITTKAFILFKQPLEFIVAAPGAQNFEIENKTRSVRQRFVSTIVTPYAGNSYDVNPRKWELIYAL